MNSTAPSAGTLAGTLAGVGEFGLIARITTDLASQPADPRVVVGPGDDAAVVAVGVGRAALTVDVLVENRHFTLEWSTPEQIGAKAAAASLADLVAMGATPVALVVGFCGPGTLPLSWATACNSGIETEARRAGAQVVGGDVSAADQVMLSITGIGDLQGRSAVLRSGARSGDHVAVCGRLGWSAAGLALLRAGLSEPTALVDDHRQPRPPYELGLQAAERASAMIDISDGLIADARHIAQASGVQIRLRRTLLPVDPLLIAAAECLERSAQPSDAVPPGDQILDWICHGGEDHALLATFPDEVPAGFTVIGQVLDGDCGVWLDTQPIKQGGGHEHFRA